MGTITTPHDSTRVPVVGAKIHKNETSKDKIKIQKLDTRLAQNYRYLDEKMLLSDFNLAGFASVLAVVFTNPLEVIKTRIQLQGELAARGTYVKSYKGVISAFVAVAKHDGIFALQKGLVPALWFQYILNSCRLSIFDFAKSLGLTRAGEKQSIVNSMFFGGIGGIVGSATASPFFLIKTHLQSQSYSVVAVGHQHDHTGMIDAFKYIYSQHGIKGLYRGVLGTVPRSAMGSGSQLASFEWTKSFMKRHQLESNNPGLNSTLASIIAGGVTCVAITPPDVILTRLYNQGIDSKGKGLLYDGVIDCAIKILKTEGFFGLYKGFCTNCIRIGPHTILVLSFYDELKRLRAKYT